MILTGTAHSAVLLTGFLQEGLLDKHATSFNDPKQLCWSCSACACRACAVCSVPLQKLTLVMTSICLLTDCVSGDAQGCTDGRVCGPCWTDGDVLGVDAGCTTRVSQHLLCVLMMTSMAARVLHNNTPECMLLPSL